ncbi:serpin peptidase inhibitor, clade A (alpha-1 antiproteinase, antitrypsin), member 10a [Notolabrus celidotus]|uniref:serpin peptidase inhibitor, clade A (alpha-1 antiproteinase, antitrypsin), member 10a n=1 Tax=Notolabrus celidotus TaxID=1203425 RepID=UPI00149066A1|nr:serpin peptidase inhibitor, clade A (alpha-1 antiproteinase, antitrypsin), member 10a [Notolabrus celidotus]XP_034555255.1 serpin peptidase inhibitor, clade A (alpha-1 antiproteinase, antitrypsin), member 10a [Notolabrus celidotus]XP_034555256.1 serpin peptidase inhibitor, clade A (alpha-1 antiproteinase, antitrypsin), member 10a [Notolabrus celidotus]XP_034555257.1 serpin peptidase inhibitor, clade A (alpha-1 antiproteinase, antitrypsin), member 10a [Notolabrus celidotus]
MTRSTLLSLVGLVLVSLASSQTVDPSLQDLANRNADFAARLYRSVSSRTDDNVFLCPFTLATGLSALLGATSGSTQDQLLRGLSLNGLDPQSLPELVQSLRNLVLQGSLSMNLMQGMAVFPAQSLKVSPSYLEQVQTNFGGNSLSVDYTVPQEATDTINRWVQDNTGDQIQELVTSLDPQTQLLLATAASYQIRFSPSFNASLTQDERFYVDKYHVAIVPMMFQADKFFLAYDRALKAGVLKLPMNDGAAMLVVLPDEGIDITAVEEEVNGEKIRAWIRQLKKTKLEVQLPRFLLERSYTLRDALRILNITQVFQDDADIINIGETTGLKLTQVYHKSVMTVDESTDDITAGGGVNAFSTLPPRLTINRPFLFVIYQQTSSSVLFMGRVTDPTKK